MTPEDVKRMLHELDRKQPLESPADRWRREQGEIEQQRAVARPRDRNLTDSEMARWCSYFDERIAAVEGLFENRFEFQRDVLAGALAEIRYQIIETTKQMISKAVAEAVEGLRQELSKRAATESGTVVQLPNPLRRRSDAAA
jgi:hypothetical protein